MDDLAQRQYHALDHTGQLGAHASHDYGDFEARLSVVLEPWPCWLVTVSIHQPGTDRLWLTDHWTPEMLIVAVMAAEAELTDAGIGEGIQRVSTICVLMSRCCSAGEVDYLQGRWDRERGG